MLAVVITDFPAVPSSACRLGFALTTLRVACSVPVFESVFVVAAMMCGMVFARVSQRRRATLAVTAEAAGSGGNHPWKGDDAPWRLEQDLEQVSRGKGA